MKHLSLLCCVFVALTGCDGALTEADYNSMTDSELAVALQNVSPADMPEDTGCRTAGAWASANPDLVPHDLQGLRGLPNSLQAAAVSTLPPSSLSQVWISRFEEVSPLLGTDEARELSRISDTITPEWIAEVSALPEEERAARVEAEVGTAARLIEVYGDAAPTLFTSIRRLDTSEPGGPLGIEHGGGDPNCSCSQMSDWCIQAGHNLDCSGGGCEHGNGCGLLFLFECNGVCRAEG